MMQDQQKGIVKDLKKRVKDLLKEEENLRCSECFSKKHKPKFMAILKAPIDSGNKQLGIFCCKDCHGFLEALGSEYCHVKSLKNPEEWTHLDVETLERSGNKAVNAIYLSALQGNHTKKDMGSLASPAYVESKYKQCLYFSQAAFHEQMQLRAMIQFAKDQKPMEPALPTTTDKLEMALKRQKSVNLTSKEDGPLLRGFGSSNHGPTTRLRRSTTLAPDAELNLSTGAGDRLSHKTQVQRATSFSEENAQWRSFRRTQATRHAIEQRSLRPSQRRGVRRVTSANAEAMKDAEWNLRPRSRSSSREPSAALLRPKSNHIQRSPLQRPSVRRTASMKRSPQPNHVSRRPSSRSPYKGGTGSNHSSPSNKRTVNGVSSSRQSPTRPKSVRAISKPRPKLEQNLDDSLSATDDDSSLLLSDVESIFNDDISDSDDTCSSLETDASNSHNYQGSHGSKLELLSEALQAFATKAEEPQAEASLHSIDAALVDTQEPYLRRQMILDAVSTAEKSDQSIPTLLMKKAEIESKGTDSKNGEEGGSTSASSSPREPFEKRQMIADAVQRLEGEQHAMNLSSLSKASIGSSAHPSDTVWENQRESFQKRQLLADMLETGVQVSNSCLQGNHFAATNGLQRTNSAMSMSVDGTVLVDS